MPSFASEVTVIPWKASTEGAAMKKRVLLTVACALALGAATPVLAASNPSGHGPPTQSCEDKPSSPPGFSTGGFANAENHYNPRSQYDVACYQVSQPH